MLLLNIEYFAQKTTRLSHYPLALKKDLYKRMRPLGHTRLLEKHVVKDVISAFCHFLLTYAWSVLLSLLQAQTKFSHHTLHSLAVTWPETGYMWLIGTKTSM